MTVRALVDRQEIEELLIAYCYYLDQMELDKLAALFTPDCEVVYGSHPALRASGTAALADSLERLWRWARTSHHLSNVRVRFDGDDAADVGSYVLAWHERADGSTATVYGQYRDRVERTADGWRIARRQMLMNGNDAGFTLSIPALQRRSPPPGWEPPELGD